MKTCTKCKESKNIEDFANNKRSSDGKLSSCRSCESLRKKKYFQPYSEKTEKEKAELYEYHTQYRLANKDKVNAFSIKYNRICREAAIERYGGKCMCCGESTYEFLCIDHINNDGNKHRKEMNSTKIHRWLKKNKYPEGFQVLCHNCNLAKGFYGECPHSKQITVIENSNKLVEVTDGVN